MEFLIAYPFVVRILWMIIVPGVMSLVTILRIRKLSLKSGEIYYKRVEKPTGEIFTAIIIVLLASLIISPTNFSRSMIILVVVLVGYIFGFVERIIESLRNGIYEFQIVRLGFSCGWEEVEGVIFGDSTIRFIHKEKGAFDFNLHQSKIAEIKDNILKHVDEVEGSI